jgi:hypothetical protein
VGGWWSKASGRQLAKISSGLIWLKIFINIRKIRGITYIQLDWAGIYMRLPSSHIQAKKGASPSTAEVHALEIIHGSL